MPQSSRGGIRLPKQILKQLDIGVAPVKTRQDHGQTSRKAQRRAARVEKKSRNARSRHMIQQRNIALRHKTRVEDHIDSEQSQQSPEPTIIERASDGESATAKITASQASTAIELVPEDSKPRKLKRKTQDLLDQDDAEIAALEKKLGLKGKKGLPQAFADDGLSGLLDGLDEGARDESDNSSIGEEAREWLRKKRQRASTGDQPNDRSSEAESSGFEGWGSETDSSKGSQLDSFSTDTKHVASSQETSRIASPSLSSKYLEAEISEGQIQDSMAGSPELFQLQKLARRCVNQISEANFISTISDAQQLYQNYPRRHVSEVLLETILSHIGGRDALSDSFLILYSGFLVAIYKAIGPDFGVSAVRKVTSAAEQSLSDPSHVNTSANLLTTLTQLFNLRLISSELIYDFIRQFVTEISERNTQLLLRIMKLCGTQLRQEDPSSLKDIVIHLQSAVTKIPEQDLSVRSKFMIEMITDLKNNKSKPVVNAASLAQEQIHRMKKLLATTGHSHIHASEPLCIKLSDLHDHTKTGQWWLAGARHRHSVKSEARSEPNGHHKDIDNGQDMQELASDQRMNTDIRRSIFISFMSASDGKDAHSRLLGLNLKKSQDLEIPKVLIHCLTAEEYYNPYYAFVAEQLCAARRMKIAFQISLWNALRQAEDEEDHDEEDDLRTGDAKLRSLIHLGKMFGELVARQRLDLKGMRNLEFATISARMQAFLEVFLLTIITRAYRRRSNQQPALFSIFQPLCDTPNIAHAVRHLVKSMIRNSDMVTSIPEQERLHHGCDVVEQVLQEKP